MQYLSHGGVTSLILCGSGYHKGLGYYAVFFEDPSGDGWKSALAPKEPDEAVMVEPFSAEPAPAFD